MRERRECEIPISHSMGGFLGRVSYWWSIEDIGPPQIHVLGTVGREGKEVGVVCFRNGRERSGG